MAELTIEEGATGLLQCPSEWQCPVHGIVDPNVTIVSTIPGHEGNWCMLCVLEQLDTLGVSRVEPTDPNNANEPN